MQRRIAIAALAAAGVATAWPVAAQDAASTYPNKPIRVIVDFPPGGTVDVLTRTLAQKLSDKWGQPVIVDNRPGAGGNIGAQAVATAAPDGYTLLATPPGPLTINQYLYKEMPFDPTAMVPVVLMAGVPNGITARADFPANSVKELIDYIKAHPGAVNYGSQGYGSTSHLTGQMFAGQIGGEMVHIPFRGEGPALTELLGGRIDLFFGNVSAVLKFREQHQVKLLGLAAAKRGFMAPDVPAAGEFGLPDFIAAAWFGIAAPKGTPAAIVIKFNEAVNEALKLQGVREALALQGAEAIGGTPADMNSLLVSERTRWKKVIETGNIRLD